MCVYVCLWVCAYKCRYLQKPEASAFPGAVMAGISSERYYLCAQDGTHSGPLEEEYFLLTIG